MFSPSIQTIISLKLNPLELLPSGGSFQATVERDPSQGLVLNAGKVRVPLPEHTALTPGQRVTAEPLRTPQGMQLRLTVVDSPTPGTQAPAATTTITTATAAPPATGAAAPIPQPPLVATLFNNLLEVLATGTLPAARAVPGLLQLRGLLTQPDDMRAALTEVLAHLDRAAAAGVELKAPVEPLRQLLAALTGSADDVEASLRQAAERAGKSMEGHVARVLAGGRPEDLALFAKQDVRGIVAQLRQDPDLKAFLQKEGSLESFTAKAGAVTERLTAENIQNLKGNEQAYRFFELPAAPAAGLFRAQFHVMGEPGKRSYAEDGAGASVAFDLGLSNLGDMWIHLRAIGSTCTCRFLAASPEAVDALSGERDQLVAALQTAGFRAASVTVEPWDGNRMRELIAILRPPGALDVSI